MSSYTPDELWRRMDQQDKWWGERFRGLEDRAAEDRRSFVPQSVYEERHLSLRDRVLELETYRIDQDRRRQEEISQARAFRQQVLLAMLVSVLGTIGAVVAAIVAVALH